MADVIKGIPNVALFVVAAGAAYYFFIYESDEDKAKRVAKESCG